MSLASCFGGVGTEIQQSSEVMMMVIVWQLESKTFLRSFRGITVHSVLSDKNKRHE